MGNLKVLGGNFLTGDGSNFSRGRFRLRTPAHSFLGEVISRSQLLSLEIATEENVKNVGGTVGWGAAGLVMLGPVGLLAGALLGGRKKQVTFVARFKDGRRLLATTDSGTYKDLLAANF